jgi:hypothetical protein
MGNETLLFSFISLVSIFTANFNPLPATMTDEKSNISSNVEKEHVRRWETEGAPPSFIKHAIDPDEALKAFEGYEGEVLVLDAATNKRLLRKIDLHLMPVCSTCCNGS